MNDTEEPDSVFARALDLEHAAHDLAEAAGDDAPGLAELRRAAGQVVQGAESGASRRRGPLPLWRERLSEYGGDPEEMLGESSAPPEPYWREAMRSHGGDPEELLTGSGR